MSLYEYEESKRISASDPSFYALIMAAMRQADSHNIAKLQSSFPYTWMELLARYHAPGGVLPDPLPPESPAEPYQTYVTRCRLWSEKPMPLDDFRKAVGG